jgi:hypothetical protein
VTATVRYDVVAQTLDRVGIQESILFGASSSPAPNRLGYVKPARPQVEAAREHVKERAFPWEWAMSGGRLTGVCQICAPL